VATVLNFLSSSLILRQNKLECLSLASFWVSLMFMSKAKNIYGQENKFNEIDALWQCY
jgi:hypothetical protein